MGWKAAGRREAGNVKMMKTSSVLLLILLILIIRCIR